MEDYNYEKVYCSTVKKHIEQMNKKFKYVYSVMHPFEFNNDGTFEIYSEKLEEKIFEYKLGNLILKYFGTIDGYEIRTIPTNEFLDNWVHQNLKLSDVDEWFFLEKDGEVLNQDDNKEFYKEFFSLTQNHFTNEENWNEFTYDGDKLRKWFPITWRELCNKYKIEYDSGIRIPRIINWFNENGWPRNVRWPREWATKEINLVLDKLNEEFEKFGNHESYITILGSNSDIKEFLTKNMLEYLVEKTPIANP